MDLSKAPLGSGYTLLFFTPAEASTIDALVAEIIPDEQGSPGARGAGVVEYIDHSLAGYLHELQPLYRNGIRALSEYASARFGATLRFLDDRRREAVVEELDNLVAADPQDPQDPQDRLGEFFRLVREHTVQGYFGDPAYGGNRDAAGWALLGFPGAQRGYSLDQLKPGFDGSQIPILTVNDLYRQIYARRLAPTNEGTAGAPNAAEIFR
jgi:gluconate 2-dehydrogenase gamma chain